MEEEDLDHILLDQYHSCQRQLRTTRKIRKLLKNDPNLDRVDENIHKKMKFFEEMIVDKNILKHKKPKIKKQSQEDVLNRNPIYNMYKNAYMITFIGYKMMYNYMEEYMNNFYKKSK